MLRSHRSLPHRARPALYIASLALLLFSLEATRNAYADPLTELLEKAQRGVQEITDSSAGPSALTFVWLSTSSLERPQRQALIDRSIRSATQEATRFLKDLGVQSLKPGLLVKRLNVTHVKVDERLPLNLKALIQLVRDPAKQSIIQGAQSATLISYRGDTLRGHEQVKLTCSATLGGLVPLKEDGVLVLLEPQVSLSLAELQARCDEQEGDGALQRWARPDIERLESGEVRLVSRGRAQLGQPELELGPIPAEQARLLWPAFIAHLTGAPKANEGPLRLGTARCARPAHLIEGSCVRLTQHSSAPPARGVEHD